MAKTIDIYNEAKRREPDLLILMRCGDFYETYNNDAETCGQVLGIIVTRRNGGDYALAGFPHHALDNYLPKLIRAGHRVRIIDGGRDTVFKADEQGGIVFTEKKTSNNNNQKTTTTMATTVKNFLTISDGVRYMFNSDMQSLVEVKPLREVFHLDSGVCEQYWRVANTDKVVKTCYAPATEDKAASFDGKLYQTFEAFEKGEMMTIEQLFYMKNDESQICSCLLKPHQRRINIDVDGAYFWTIEKGEAVKWYFRKHIDTVTWEYNEKGQIEVKSDCEDELPPCYNSSEDVYKYNDYRFVDGDGHETVREGVLKRLFLDDDQKVLVEKMQQAIDACKAAGVCIYWSNADYTLNAVNVRRVERIEYDPSVDEDTEEAHYFDDSRVSHVFGNVTDYNSEDDSVKFVIKKQ